MSVPKARLRIRDQHNLYWLDCCNHPTYIRNQTNTGWVPVNPGSSYIQEPTYAEVWHLISCEFDPDYDDPCDDVLEAVDDCTGNKSEEYDGSGNGIGSGGAPYDSILGYPHGYDMPDSGDRGFGVTTSGGKMVLYRPGTGKQYTYTYGAMNGEGTGTWERPIGYNDAYNVVGQISEVILQTDPSKPCFPIYFNNNECCAAIDVYCEGKRIATTCGAACGSGVLWACCEGKVLIRITNPQLEGCEDNNVNIGIGVCKDLYRSKGGTLRLAQEYMMYRLQVPCPTVALSLKKRLSKEYQALQQGA